MFAPSLNNRVTGLGWGSFNQKGIYSTHHTPPKWFVAQALNKANVECRNCGHVMWQEGR